MRDPLEWAARAVCAKSLSGFCSNVGGEIGCKAGRGSPCIPENCIATPAQLMLSGHLGVAEAAIASWQSASVDEQPQAENAQRLSPEGVPARPVAIAKGDAHAR